MTKYSRQETLAQIKLEILNIQNLYKANCINWKGLTIENELYSEVISSELLQNLSLLLDIKQITRKSDYIQDHHSKIEFNISESNRMEEIFSKRIYDLEFNDLGKVIDYQIPLRDTANDKGIKALDLLTYNKSSSILYLVEVKYLGNKETLLRAILECYTYYKILDIDKLISEFQIKKSKKVHRVKPAILLVTSNNNPCNAYKELEDICNRPMLRALLLSLEIDVFSCNLDNLIFKENSI